MNNSKEWIESFNLHYNNSDKSAPELNAYFFVSDTSTG